MTSAQFFVGIAVPSILVLLAWVHQNVRLTEFRGDVNRQFDDVGRRFTAVDRQFDKIDRQFDKIDRQFDEIGRRLVLIEGDQKQFFALTGKLEGRIEELHRK